MQSKTPIIIDTDPGVDDAMAILFAAADLQVELLGLTTIFGNVRTETATRNALQLLELAGLDAPVAHGAATPLRRVPAPPADFVHGAEGFGEAMLPAPAAAADARDAAQFLIETVAARPGEITLLPIGPLTNIAIALERDPAIAGKVKEVVVMGGAVRTKGNVSDYAEANIWNDPDAAAAVFAADWPVRLVGLDVTQNIRLAREDLTAMVAASPRAGAFLSEAAEFYFAFHQKTRGVDGCFLHDPAALAAALDPSLFQMVSAPVRVVTDGDEMGRTVEAPNAGTRPVEICVDADAEGVRARMLSALCSGRLP